MHTIALYTYGTELRHERSCVKCTQTVPITLLRLFGDHASDCTPAHAVYHYIHVPNVRLIHSFLVLKLTDEEKSLVESLTRPHRGSSQTFLWQGGNWYEFPFGDGSLTSHQDYRLALTTSATSYPLFPGDNAPHLIPSQVDAATNAGVASSGAITIQRSDREGHGKTWWWIGGDTKPVKDIISQAGAHWSRRRQEWYYIGATLPAAIQALAAPAAPPAATELVQREVLDRLFAAAVATDPVELAQRSNGASQPIEPPYQDRATAAELGNSPINPNNGGAARAQERSDPLEIAQRQRLDSERQPGETLYRERLSASTHAAELGNSPVIPNYRAEARSTPSGGSASEPTRYSATPIRTSASEVSASDEGVMRSVQTDDVQAALIAHIHDWERSKPILIDFVGSRNAIKQLLAKPFNPGNIGRGDGVGFTMVNGSNYSSFRLPDLSYKTLSIGLKNRAVEGRIVSLDATTAAPRQECYVLVSEKICIPQEGSSEAVSEAWLRYVRYSQTPNRPEFAHYEPPVWAHNLYNVYQALRVRLGRPLHVGWMPWLFEQVADQQFTSSALGVNGIVLCRYIAGYVAPQARGAVEQGAYRLTCASVSDLWGEVIMQNPHRSEGISFSSEEKGTAL